MLWIQMQGKNIRSPLDWKLTVSVV